MISKGEAAGGSYVTRIITQVLTRIRQSLEAELTLVRTSHTTPAQPESHSYETRTWVDTDTILRNHLDQAKTPTPSESFASLLDAKVVQIEHET